MATKLGLFNAALYDLGHLPLSDTGETVEGGRILAQIYDRVVEECLAAAPWNFAAVNYYPTGDTGLITPAEVGYNYGYAKPTDWVRTITVSDDQYMVFPLTQYFDTQELWAADTGELFIRYVSNDTGTGLDLANWPPHFTRFVETALAERACLRLTQDREARNDLVALKGKAFKDAQLQNNTDGAAPRFAPATSWQSLYQRILAELGDGSLLTERSGEGRRAIEDLYDDVLKDCLQLTDWNFATKTIFDTGSAADTGILAGGGIGYAYGYAKPTDWVRTSIVSDHRHAVFPLTQYWDGPEYWGADTGHLTIRYVADDTGDGRNISVWPTQFRRYFELEMAIRIFSRLVEPTPELRELVESNYATLLKKRDEAKEAALTQNVDDNPQPRYAPDGDWAQWYQEILTELGDDALLTGRSGQARRAIEDVLDEVKVDCLTAAEWSFATKTIQPTGTQADTGLLAGGGIGYVWGYAKPTDWLKTLIVSDDPYAVFPLTQYYDGNNYWAADTGEITVRYIANDTGTGLNVSEWPPTFRRYVTLEVASRICKRLLPDTSLDDVKELYLKRDMAFARAKEDNQDSNANPRYAPAGSWQNLYQEILTEIGDDTLLHTRSGKGRRAIEDVYDEVLRDCLSVTDWNWAVVTAQPTGSTTDTGVLAGGGIGYTWGFPKPSDWVRTSIVSDDPYAVFPLTQYYDGQTYWAADTGHITVRYVSDDTGMGKNISSWTSPFRRYFELSVAVRIYHRLMDFHEVAGQTRGQVQNDLATALAGKQDQDQLEAEYDKLAKRRDEALQLAVTQNMQDGARPRFAPTGSWQNFYQQVLTEIGEPELLTIRSGEARRAIDDVYTDALNECLQAGSWNFAMETVKLDADTGVVPEFGFAEVFAKPSDWVRTIGISGDQYFSYPLTQYVDDATFLSADSTPIYLRYVSNDTGLGGDTGLWPITFQRYFQCELAARVCRRLTKDDKRTLLMEAQRDKSRRKALNLDSMNEPNPKFPPPGGWTTSRWRGVQGERGNRNKLTGD